MEYIGCRKWYQHVNICKIYVLILRDSITIHYIDTYFTTMHLFLTKCNTRKSVTSERVHEKARPARQSKVLPFMAYTFFGHTSPAVIVHLLPNIIKQVYIEERESNSYKDYSINITREFF